MDRRDRNAQRDETPPSEGIGEDVDSSLLDAADPMSLRELTDAAEVSVRTVRYYISEGLLPPPEGSGSASAYSGAHLDRLRLIHQLKEAYLPLKEIRRRLAGLDDDSIRAVLNGNSFDPNSDQESGVIPDPTMAGAREYLSMMESRQTYRTEPLALTLPPASAHLPSPAMSQRSRQRNSAPHAAELSPATARPSTEMESTLWHRIPLGEEAELVISDEAYVRHPDRVDWLVRWARKVFG